MCGKFRYYFTLYGLETRFGLCFVELVTEVIMSVFEEDLPLKFGIQRCKMLVALMVGQSIGEVIECLNRVVVCDFCRQRMEARD